MKKITILLLSLVLTISLALNVYASNEIIKIGLNTSFVLLPENTSVSLASSTNNGSTEDIGKSENIVVENVINITEPGNYEFSGTVEDAQIAINANVIEGDVNIILNNVNITCKDAPAILVYSKDINNDKCKVTITTLEGTTNNISGGRMKASVMELANQDEVVYSIEKAYDDDGTYYERYKYDGAISSDISINFDGEGVLNLTATGKEGIETKMHVTIDGGTLIINSIDDAINAATDGKSIITINDGVVVANLVEEAEEGDGIDSNGYLYINGGVVYALSCPGADSGIDSDMGTYINGGEVFSISSMTENLTTSNGTKFIQKMVSGVDKGSLITIADENKNVIFAYEADRKVGSITYSSAKVQDGNYSVYVGGDVTGEKNDFGIYTNIESANIEDAQEQTSNAMQMNGRPGFIPNVGGMYMPQERTFNKSLFISLIVVAAILIVILVVMNVKAIKSEDKKKYVEVLVSLANIILSFIMAICIISCVFMVMESQRSENEMYFENRQNFGGMPSGDNNLNGNVRPGRNNMNMGEPPVM